MYHIKKIIEVRFFNTLPRGHCPTEIPVVFAVEDDEG